MYGILNTALERLKKHMQTESSIPLHGCRSLCAGSTSRLGDGFLFMKHAHNFKDLTGIQFSRLTVVRFNRTDKNSSSFWDCLCKCGTPVVVEGKKLSSKHTKSCGCLRGEAGRWFTPTHGGSRTPEYSSWSKMISRCYNPKGKFYKDYGGRGITVCEEWLTSFLTFQRDMGTRPKGLSIGRINNDGNYTPNNCRWETRREQNSNTRSNRLLSFNGKTMTMTQWANFIGIRVGTIHARLRAKWSVEKTLTTPLLCNS